MQGGEFLDPGKDGQCCRADLQQYHIGKVYYGYSPSTGQIIAFSNPDNLALYFPGGLNKQAPVLPAGVDHSAADASPDQLITGLFVGSVSGQSAAGLQMPPTAQAGGAAAAAQTSGTYVVKKGDTLWKIAKATTGDGRNWRKILVANPDCLGQAGNTKTLKAGFTLAIPQI